MAAERPVPPGLKEHWNSSLQEFAELEPNTFAREEQERHRIFSLLLMGMVHARWNDNKYTEIGDYGEWRADQVIGETAEGMKVYAGGSYQGHNIAALAVDGEGRIIDFEFNHNEVFDSTVEHAESRLVRRVFALNQIYDPWYTLNRDRSTQATQEGERRAERHYSRRNLFATNISEGALRPSTEIDGTKKLTAAAPIPLPSMLKDVTIYTSLESCAQCSGIMCLAAVKDVVYLQWDQGQFLIGNMMRRATASSAGFSAPRPIRADEFGLPYFAQLNEAATQFEKRVVQSPFYEGPATSSPSKSPSITSFLCTDRARAIYGDATDELAAWTSAKRPTYKPTASAFSNQEVLVQAHDFLEWIGELDSRGAPHRV